MKEDDVIRITKNFLCKQFPKDCNCCGKRYDSLAVYLRNTTHIGKPLSYDMENEDWFPRKPLGTFSFYRCTCGTSLTLSSHGMRVVTLWRLMNWIRKEAKAQGVKIPKILDDLRNKIEASVLKDDDKNVCSTI
jgi:hypothetical protein